MWCWRRLLRVPWIAGRSNQSILKEINPEYSLEGLMLKPKLQYFATLREKLTHWKRRWCWERLRAGGKGLTEDEMAGWFYQLNGHSLSKFQEVVKDREAWHAAVHEAAKNEKQFSKWTTTKKNTKNCNDLQTSLLSRNHDVFILKPSMLAQLSAQWTCKKYSLIFSTMEETAVLNFKLCS